MKSLKLMVITMIGLCSINSYAVTLDVTDTLYHFAKKCNAQGRVAYFQDDAGCWQPYAVNQIYQEYKYMLDIAAFGSLSNDSEPSISSKDVQMYLDRTRAKRLAEANGYLACK